MSRHADGDELIAVRCLLGERAAFDELVERWYEPLALYTRSLLADDDEAADVLQDAWLRILRALPRLREPARIRAWLFGIARRSVMDRLRKHYAEPVDDDADVSALPDRTGGPDVALDDETAAIERAAVLANLQRALHALPVVDREVLVLFYLQDLSLVQISEIQDVPVGTVKSRLHRARGALRRTLTSEKETA